MTWIRTGTGMTFQGKGLCGLRMTRSCRARAGILMALGTGCITRGMAMSGFLDMAGDMRPIAAVCGISTITSAGAGLRAGAAARGGTAADGTAAMAVAEAGTTSGGIRTGISRLDGHNRDRFIRILVDHVR